MGHQQPARVLIVGAGLAGLTAAAELGGQGIETVVVDKGRAPGGRMATRTDQGARFDHGAQHFNVRSDTFRRVLDGWIERGIVREWFSSRSLSDPGRAGEARYIGTGGMRGVAEDLASRSTVRTALTVTRLVETAAGVVAMNGRDVAAQGDVVILTPPLPQTLQLLRMSGIASPADLTRMLEPIEYEACLAVLAHLDRPAGWSDGHKSFTTGPIAWMADNQHKGISPMPAVTIHSTPEFADAHLTADPADWVEELSAAASVHLPATILRATGHRWRFARPRTTLGIGAVTFESFVPIVLAGEVFSGARVEGAYLSGLAAAQQVLRFL